MPVGIFHQLHTHTGLIALQHEGAGAIELCHAPAVTSGLAGLCGIDGTVGSRQNRQERRVHLRHVDVEVRVVHNLNASQFIGFAIEKCVVALHLVHQAGHLQLLDQTLQRILDIIAGEDCAVVELDAIFQLKGVGQLIIRQGGHASEQCRLQAAIRVGGQQRLRDVVGHLHDIAVGIQLHIQGDLGILRCHPQDLLAAPSGLFGRRILSTGSAAGGHAGNQHYHSEKQAQILPFHKILL